MKIYHYCVLVLTLCGLKIYGMHSTPLSIDQVAKTIGALIAADAPDIALAAVIGRFLEVKDFSIQEALIKIMHEAHLENCIASHFPETFIKIALSDYHLKFKDDPNSWWHKGEAMRIFFDSLDSHKLWPQIVEKHPYLIQRAAALGLDAIITQFIDHGVSPDYIANPFFLSPLEFAARNKHTSTVRLLLDRGASTLPRLLVKNVLGAAAEAGNREIMRMLLQQRKKECLRSNIPQGRFSDEVGVLLRAAQAGNEETFLVCIGEGFGDTRECDHSSGKTLLEVAIAARAQKIVARLKK